MHKKVILLVEDNPIYIRKPVDCQQFAEAVRTLDLYWVVLNEPPPLK
jgi:hypothetical protein